MEWQFVVDQRWGGYVDGFDPNAVYEFKRLSDDEIHTFRMADKHPYFNIANLFWRVPEPPQ